LLDIASNVFLSVVSNILFFTKWRKISLRLLPSENLVKSQTYFA
jgi:hypothetical protein